MAIQSIYDTSMQVAEGIPGNTGRGLFSDWFNAKNIAREDLERDIYLQTYANQFAAEEAQKNRDWQEEMSNTAYQRAVEDMKKAGLNPVLAVSQGGASTPSGGAASSSSVGRSKGTVAPTGEAIQLIGQIVSLVGSIVSGNIGAAAKLGAANIMKGK